MPYGAIDTTVPPSAEPVSLAEMLAHLRIDAPDETQTGVLTGAIAAARLHVERSTGRALVTQALRQRLDAFPPLGGRIVLLRTPAVSVTSVEYVDASGETQTLTPNLDYVASLGEGCSTIGPIGGAWPLARNQPGAVTVTYVAGYGNAAAVPRDLVAAIKLLAASWYVQRSDSVSGVAISAIPRGVESIVNLYRTALAW